MNTTSRKGRLVASLVALLLGALLLGLASCSNSEAGGGQEKTLFIGQVNPPITFNPLNAPTIASQYDQMPIFDSLLGMVEPLEFSPLLADVFEIVDDTTLHIELNSKANWTDGTPITADDVAFTINMIANPQVETAIGSYISHFAGLDARGKLPEGETELSSVHVIDDKTLEIELSSAVDVNIIKELFGVNLRILPKHRLENVDPATFGQDPYFSAPDVTSGAYTFVRYEKDQYVEYAANPDYYRGAPNIEHIFIKLVQATSLSTMLETGEIHFNTGIGIGNIPSTDFESTQALENIHTKTEPNTSVQMVMFNVDSIQDPRVRQAMAYAMDRESVLENLLRGSGEVVDALYTSLNPYLDTSIPQYSYDPDKAKELLEEAGWDFDREINLVVPVGNKNREQLANILAQNLTDVGFHVSMNKYDFPTTMQKALAHDFDILLIGNNFALDPDGIAVMLESGQPYNFPQYSNAEVDELFEAGRNEPDAEKRYEIYSRIQQILHDELPIITAYSYHELVGVSNDLINGGPSFFGTWYNAYQWDLQ